MDISCTFKERVVHITEIIPSQSSGNFYVVWVDNVNNTVGMTEINTPGELKEIATTVTHIGSL